MFSHISLNSLALSLVVLGDLAMATSLPVGPTVRSSTRPFLVDVTFEADARITSQIDYVSDRPRRQLRLLKQSTASLSAAPR
jgi:hypothetical protein